VGEAFRILEKAMLLHLTYPAESTLLPMLTNFRKAPRLQMFDTGLVNYISKIQPTLFVASDLTDTYRGRVAEHIVGQELLAIEKSVLSTLHFWTREQKNAQAEIDFVLPFQGKLIPVEVKSGGIGKFKSLALFMEDAGHGTAIRFWSRPYSIDQSRTASGKIFTLYNLPFYHAGNLLNILSTVMV
jgi:predicted AAA+ superfamily ATPase